MKLGVFTVLFGKLDFEAMLKKVKSYGLQAIEIGTGNYPGNPHCPVDELLNSPKKLKDYKAAIEDAGLEISALSCHGNPLHPNPDVAKGFQDTFRKTVRLAEKLGVSVVIDFSGCPGDSETAKSPNWVTCPWPDDFSKIIQWQWEAVAIPYWKKAAKFAADHGVKVALEMHPGFLVHSADTLLRLRQATADNIGANFDPSHLFWQGMDPVACVRKLKGAIFHVHAKDCRIDPYNTATAGVLDTKPYTDEINRSWIFRTVGYGHDYDFWKAFVSNLRMVGYDGALSIEHEDSLMSVDEGFCKAVEFLKTVLLTEMPGKAWWV